MAKSKRNVSAQTRVKLSRAAKNRRRGPKGSIYAGRFMDSVHNLTRPKISHAGSTPYSGRHFPGGPSGIGKSGIHTASEDRITMQDFHGKIKRGEDTEQMAYLATKGAKAGDTVKVERPSVLEQPVRITSGNIRESELLRREALWKNKPVYGNDDAKTKKKFISTSKFISSEMPAEHRKELDRLISDPDSPLNAGLDLSGPKTVRGAYHSAAQRRRVDQYVKNLQLGQSHEQALHNIATATQGRRPEGARGPGGVMSRAEGKAVAARTPRERGRAHRYESVAPTPREFQVGVSTGHADSLSALGKRFKADELSEKDLIQIQQFQRMHLADEMRKNNLWARETKAANLRGQERGVGGSSRNKVVFFTTSLGHPSPSVPADSLIGQYIIQRRKRMLIKEGVYKRKDLQGAFPDAVRDMHVVEASTGTSFGAEGRWGAFQKSGWRVGAKKSRNFGKPVPVGSQVLYDSAGRPIYDSEGNIRYSEGATRPFKFETMKELGLRVFIG